MGSSLLCGISIIFSNLGKKVPSHEEEILLPLTEAAHRDLRKKGMEKKARELKEFLQVQNI